MKTISTALATATAIAIQFGSASVAQAETLKISTFLPPQHAFNRALQAWGEELSEKSEGDLSVEIFPAGQLGPPPRQFDLVRSGGADVSVVLHGATPGRFPLSELAGLPLVAPSAGSESATTSRRLTELAQEYLVDEHAGTRVLWMAVTPPLMFHVHGFEPQDLSNFEGKRIRYAGAVWQKVIEALGASPVPVPPAETADAMGKGIVDGATFPFEATIPFDLAPVSEYTLTPGIAGATFSVIIGEHAYRRLSDEHKALVEETTGPDRAAAFGALWDEGEVRGRAYMEEGDVEVVTLDEAALGQLRSKLSDVVSKFIEDADAKGVPASAFIDAYSE